MRYALWLIVVHVVMTVIADRGPDGPQGEE
jgi:hypothetical protein